MTDKVTYLRPLGKTALQLYVNDHFQETGEKIKEWQAWEMIIQQCLPDLYKRAKRTTQRSEKNGNGVKTPHPDE